MRKLWLIRKDQEAVSPVIATILMVAITVVLAAVLYVMVSGLLGGGTTTQTKTIGLSAGSASTNWTLTVASVSGSGMTYLTTTLKIFDTGGAPKLTKLLNDIKGDPATGVCSLWSTNKACYIPSAAANAEVRVGDRLLVDKATYGSGFKYEILDSTAILAQGTFQ